MVKCLENYQIAKIGTRTFAVAVSEAMFVMDTENIDGKICLEFQKIATIGNSTLHWMLLR